MDRIFSSIRTYQGQSNNPKTCKECGGAATKEALFSVGNGIAVVERYCDQCAKNVEDRNKLAT